MGWVAAEFQHFRYAGRARGHFDLRIPPMPALRPLG